MPPSHTPLFPNSAPPLTLCLPPFYEHGIWSNIYYGIWHGGVMDKGRRDDMKTTTLNITTSFLYITFRQHLSAWTVAVELTTFYTAFLTAAAAAAAHAMLLCCHFFRSCVFGVWKRHVVLLVLFCTLGFQDRMVTCREFYCCSKPPATTMCGQPSITQVLPTMRPTIPTFLCGPMFLQRLSCMCAFPLTGSVLAYDVLFPLRTPPP